MLGKQYKKIMSNLCHKDTHENPYVWTEFYHFISEFDSVSLFFGKIHHRIPVYHYSELIAMRDNFLCDYFSGNKNNVYEDMDYEYYEDMNYVG